MVVSFQGEATDQIWQYLAILITMFDKLMRI